MLTGLSHLTLSIRSLDASISFYQDLLGLRLHARWNRGAYLSAGDLSSRLTTCRQWPYEGMVFSTTLE